MTRLTAEKLRSVLRYNRSTGLFHWRYKPIGRGGNRRVDMLAGTVSNGYISIWVDGRKYPAHRLAWLHVYGHWPRNQLDHINHKKDDNRIKNLREASYPENGWHAKRRRDNSSGFKGVYLQPKLKARPWQARISINKHRISLGYFSTPETAHVAYCKAAVKLYGKFAEFGD